ncbi:MAG: hypothetical protein GF335_03270 [Candidatus Moranbacteria bacterium]|nr:hypothetical protein [Candidatus Moranbacteria bacterium]
MINLKDKFGKNPFSFLLPIFILVVIAIKPQLLPLIIIIFILFKLNEKVLKKILNFNNSNMKYNSQNIKDAVTEASQKTKKIIFLVVILIMAVIILIKSISIVEAGQVGVYSLFGKVKDKELGNGIHIVNPLAKITKMSIRTEEYTMSVVSQEGRKSGVDSISALTKEGLNIDLDITILYSLNKKEASKVYEQVGLNYDEKIIRPAIRSTIRSVVAKYETKAIYSEKREDASKEIYETLDKKFKQRGIVLEDVLLRNVKLPSNLTRAIQEKLQAEQEAQKYDFILQREEKEKQRKIIEAQGQKESQEIINQSLSQNYLNYLYITNLENREGTIYVPTNPSTGMPMFFQNK